MNHVEIVHILQATRDVNQLNGSSVRPLRDQVATYKLDTIYIPVPLDELIDGSVLHPLGDESKSAFG